MQNHLKTCEEYRVWNTWTTLVVCCLRGTFAHPSSIPKLPVASKHVQEDPLKQEQNQLPGVRNTEYPSQLPLRA